MIKIVLMIQTSACGRMSAHPGAAAGNTVHGVLMEVGGVGIWLSNSSTFRQAVSLRKR